MKKILLLLFALIVSCISNDIEAKGAIIYHDGPKFSTLKELPSDAVIEGKHVNLGVAYEQFGLFWLPVWNYGQVEYALISDNEEEAWSLDSETLAEVKKEYNLNLPDSPSIPLLQKIGLKPIILIIILYAIWSTFLQKKKSEESEEA